MKTSFKKFLNNALWCINGVDPPERAERVQAWVERNPEQAKFQSIHHVQRDAPPRPQTLPGCPPLEHGDGGRRREDFVVAIKNGHVAHHGGNVIAPDGVLLSELSDALVLKTGKLPPVQRVAGRVGVLASACSRNYYHWTMDVLSRLALLRSSNFPVDKYFVSYNKGFQRESLAHFGIGPDQIVPATRYSHITADEIVAPTRHPSWETAVPFLRQAFPLQETRNASPKRIYISRAKANKRRVANENEVLQALAPYGFVKVLLEEMSCRDQIRLFQGVECVIGPHGAGFCNTLFSSRGTTVIEFFHQRRLKDFFVLLSDQLQHRHFYLISTHDAPRRFGWPKRKDDPDIWIDVAMLPPLLQLAGVNRGGEQSLARAA